MEQFFHPGFQGLELIGETDASPLNPLLLDGAGRLKSLPSSFIKPLERDRLRVFAHERAIYGFPVKELIEWLRFMIGGRKAIEIGAGNNCLGYHAGIPMTDSFQQTDNGEVALYYALARQPPTRPDRCHVIPMSAEEAVARFRPEVVVGSWITELCREGMNTGNLYGVDEERLFASGVKRYIHIGNLAIHGEKAIRNRPHRLYRYDWLTSRAKHPALDCIFVWDA